MKNRTLFFIGVLTVLCACETDEQKAQKLFDQASVQADSLKNYDEAIALYQQSADLGNAEAYYKLGNMYCDTVYGKTDSLKSLEYYQKAADRGIKEASSQLGVLYFYGATGIKADTIKAMKLLEKADSCNTASGFYAITDYYGSKYNTNKAKEDSIKLYQYAEKALALGHPKAYGLLGHAYAVQGEYKKAWDYYTKGAELNASNSIFQMGLILSSGEEASYFGVEPDAKKAIDLLKRVIVRYPFAATKIGFLYVNGNGIEKDVIKALYYFKIAAEAGDSAGQYNYATCLYIGEGCAVDKKKSWEYYKKSAKQGHEGAQKALRYFRW